MKRLLDTLLLVDIESTCWEDGPPPGQESEIIEVGVATLDIQSHAVASHPGYFVRPLVSRVSQFCTDLTTLTQHDVENGCDFQSILDILKQEYKSDERVWVSYGDYDKIMFEKQCSRLGLIYPFGSRHLNVKTLFALKMGLTKEIGMAAALTLLGLRLEGTHHRGGDDAYNIAKIMKYCLWGEV